MLVGEDGEGRGATVEILAGDADGVEIGAKKAAAGGRLLHFRDDGGGTGAERGAEVAAFGEARRGGTLPLVEVGSKPREFLPFVSDNAGQDVWNGVNQG